MKVPNCSKCPCTYESGCWAERDIIKRFLERKKQMRGFVIQRLRDPVQLVDRARVRERYQRKAQDVGVGG